MIIIKNLTKIFHEPLFENVSFVLHAGDKVGLVGPNGCGKSTLLKIIVGEIGCDDGEIRLDNERIGYLSQELRYASGDTVEHFLSVSKNTKIVLEKVGLGGVSQTLPISALSGGQKTRLSFARILLDSSNTLLLDEPSNHLDTEGLEWLERFIRDFHGAVLIVSHDRRLLDNTVDTMLEIDPARHAVVAYAGGYTQYALEKESESAKRENAYRRQQKEKRRMELWLALKRQEAHAHPDPAKGKQIRAMEKRLEREIYDRKVTRPGGQKKMPDLELRGAAASAKRIVRARDIQKNFPGKPLLRGVAFELRGREHVLLAGENGSGKTTLLKIVTGAAQPDSGECTLGENVRVGYFAQEHEMLDPGKTVMDEFSSTDRLLDHSKDPRSVLGSFLFSGQSVFKKISTLSLGERARLMFAKLTSQANELLVLDEPTNHLDIVSREVIENALLEYKGAILVVSHDRYFLDKIFVDRILTIQDGILKETICNTRN